jgi:uncharacterized membrane protein YbaN (DUF454 family)
MLRQTRNLLWRIVAVCAVALGVIGVVVPILPTAPLLILAAFAANKGWPALERWLLNHPVHGPHIRNWREHGAVPRKAKLVATLMMAVSAAGLMLTNVPRWSQVATTVFLLCIAVWLWGRPEKPR